MGRSVRIWNLASGAFLSIGQALASLLAAGVGGLIARSFPAARTEGHGSHGPSGEELVRHGDEGERSSLSSPRTRSLLAGARLVLGRVDQGVRLARPRRRRQRLPLGHGHLPALAAARPDLLYCPEFGAVSPGFNPLGFGMTLSPEISIDKPPYSIVTNRIPESQCITWVS